MLSDVHHTVYTFIVTCAWLTPLLILTKDKAAWFLPCCCSQAGLTTYLSTNWPIWRKLISWCAVLSPQGLNTAITGTVYVSGFVDKWAGRTTGGPLGVKMPHLVPHDRPRPVNRLLQLQCNAEHPAGQWGVGCEFFGGQFMISVQLDWAIWP